MINIFNARATIFIIVSGIFAPAFAQHATELYLPIGQSPGLSDKINLIGTIDDVDPREQSLTVTAAGNIVTVLTTEYTLIYLDKSRLEQPNRYGSLADAKKGMRVEVRFEADKRQRPAEWIKLQIDK
ncbi:hypothetical protein D1AOALGA4SA_5195 [Olavius algarvensis Delta 1 endosymbiont]|nr:hypothetical protein D1AOALGA4SA_5195 [Olavius algarvensis Delta 1 endosymbiont]